MGRTKEKSVTKMVREILHLTFIKKEVEEQEE
jgi:hypothetical protein